MANTVIIGSQWGDEGKGKIVDMLATDSDVIVRFQGGNNAGHTIEVNGERTILHTIPSGILHEEKLCLIGNGVVLDPYVFLKEVDSLKTKGVNMSATRLGISPKTHLILPYHRAIDLARESLKAGKKIGTTGRGIGPCYEDKAAAKALVDQAQGAIQEVESYLGELYLVSPADGIVSAIFPKVGELVGQGSPVASVTDIDDVWFTFNVREDYLKGLKEGDKVNVMIPALEGKEVSATVSYIAVRESYATWKATKETGMYDVKTFEVRAVPDQAVEGVRPGMSAIMK